jgi:hypothetical protein
VAYALRKREICNSVMQRHELNMTRVRILLLAFIYCCICGTELKAQVADTSFTKRDSLLQISDTLLSQDSIVTLQDSLATTATPAAEDVAETIKRNSYELTGVVKDKNTGEGVPFATVFFPGTPTGTAADLDGNFSLIVPTLPKDTLRVQAVGYNYAVRKLDKGKNKYTFFIELERADNTLGEFVFKYEDLAAKLVKEIIDRKPVNNPDRTENYRYEVYNKLEVDLQRLSKEQFEKLPVPYMKKFSFIYNSLDSTSEEKPFLPFYFTETLSDYYFRRTPKKAREFIKASQVKGIKNESITKFMGSMYQNINAYDNYIPVFDKKFVSPISNQGLFYYKYNIKDTQTAYGHQIILVQFVPRRNGENCFFGDFWVVDSVFALQRISMEVPKDANINFVNRVSVYQEFALVADSIWFCVKDKFIADFNAPYGVKLPGFIGRKTTSYRDIIINTPVVDEVVNDPKYKEDVIVSDTARHASEDFWGTARHDTLTKNEKAIYHMIDTLESLPVFTRYKNIIKFIATGVKEFGPIELGPYWNVYSSNPVEGQRFRFSMGTTPKLFKNAYLNGYVAYGTKDEKFKYKATALWLLDRKPRMYLYGSYTHDIDRSTSYYDQVSNDNLFSNLFRKSNIPFKLAFVDESRLEWFKEYFSGFSHMVTILRRDFDPYAPLPDVTIFKDEEGSPTNHIINSEVNLRLRFAYKEKFLEGNYYRFSLGTKYPVIEGRIAVGIKNLWGSGYSYKKASLSISDNAPISPLGWLYYNVFAGKYFGTLPYALLEVHPGNEFHYYNQYAFNMMNRYEFLSDQYAGINLEHSIGGGVFNYIPYLKKLKLRQFWTAKVLYGSLSDDNKALNLTKDYTFRTLEKDPYVEVGTGVANILQFFRIDFVWRVSPKLLPDEDQAKYFGIFGSVRFSF